jgi:son of sevenless-like protein
MLDGLLRHNEPTGGFSGYRTLLQNVDGPCVPFIGMYLTDLVHVQDQFSDEDGRICFVQKLKWYETVSAILRYQSKPYDIDEHDATLKFVEERLRENSNMDPNWFWSRSQEIQETEITDADLRRGLEAAGF